MKRRLLLILLAFASYYSSAQFTLNDVSRYTVSPYDVKTVDLDGDGDLDILAASTSDDKIVWYENLGDGLFGSQRIVSTQANYVWSIHAVDIDQDGDLDVISALSLDYKVAWYENDGQGNFSDEQIIATDVIAARCVYAADLDGDGDQDVICGTVGFASKIFWFENFGDGGFGTQQLITTEVDVTTSVYATDLDGDGDQDVLSSSSDDDKIAWYQNQGDGTFGDQQIISNAASGASCVYTSDLDGDGNEDVISASPDNNRITWYKNEGNGTFNEYNIISYSASFVASVHTADIDGDGNLDVLGACGGFTGTNKIIWHKNYGDGSFGFEQIISTDMDYGISVVAGDLDDDGDMDVISASGSDRKIAWYKNDGNGNFDSQIQISIEAYSPRSVHAADLDNDGDLDVISASFLDNKIAWYENLGDGSIGQQFVISTNAMEAVCVYSADLDNDGDMDVISASQGDDKIAWYENDGEGNFGQEQILSVVTGINDNFFSHIQAADLDGDGDMDIVLRRATILSANVGWHENLGDGTFGEEQTITTDPSYTISIIDLDGDGDLDIVSSSWTTPSRISWYANEGDGTFGSEQIIAETGDTDFFIFPDDLDNDGDIDILAGSYDEGEIVWFENEGEAVFGGSNFIYLINTNISDLYAADLNDDNRKDVITVYRFIPGDIAISWNENEGNGNFGPQQVIDENTATGGTLYACDLDADLDVDLLAVFPNYNKGRVLWFENNLYHETQISGSLFLDNNQNGIQDSVDIGFNQLALFSNPLSDFTYTYPDGGYFMNFNDSPGSYQIYPELYPGWYITTDSASYNVVIDSSFTSIDSLDFGFGIDDLFKSIQTDLTGGFPRCNETVNFWVDLHNFGTTLPDGIVHLELDDGIQFVSAQSEPDSIVGQNIYWHIDSLYYFSSINIGAQVEMPSFTSIGDTLVSILTVHETDEANNIVYSNTDTLRQELVCAYDPNDKSVSPTGFGAQGYIDQDQELEYLIRFQNTGTDTAFTVVVVDQLDENLDWTSFQPVATSHPVQIQVEQTGEVVFTFNNIMLPDSNVDFLGSQGFIKFRIMPDLDLLPGVQLYNTANIYFDMNPAVVTNTTINTIKCHGTPLPIIALDGESLTSGVAGIFEYQWFLNGEEIPNAISEAYIPLQNGIYSIAITDENDCSLISDDYIFNSLGIPVRMDIKGQLYPNPFKESCALVFSQPLNSDYDILITSIQGRVVQRISKYAGNALTLHQDNLGTGMFMCYLINNRTGNVILVEKFIVQ